MTSIYFPVLGAGWAPVVLETFQEIDFLRVADNATPLTSITIEHYYIASTVDLNYKGLHLNATPSGNCTND